ncbi:MAG: MerR family transcriptional regulator, partial [Burkholderiales bacterium]|nr:MerR family transcriptional regulator [Burkholderiales bacterium]
RGNRRYYQHHEVLMIRRIRDLLYDQGFTISGARNKLQEWASGDREKLREYVPALESLDALDEAESSFERLEDAVALEGDELVSYHLLSVRQELFEIRDLLSEVL